MKTIMVRNIIYLNIFGNVTDENNKGKGYRVLEFLAFRISKII